MRTVWQATLGLVLAAAWNPPCPAQNEIDVEKLRPGLVATFRDAAKPAPVEIVRLEPAIALALKPGETVHPRLAAEGGTARWEGFLNVLRPGTYRFSAQLSGGLRLHVQGKEVFNAKGDGTMVTGPEVKLDADIHPVVAEFTRLQPTARLEVFWQFQQARRDPLGHEVFFHLPDRAAVELKTYQALERGRLLAEEHACATCHQPAENDRLGRGLHQRKGPDLSQVGSRVHAGWIYEWLDAPHKVRPGAVMPQLFAADTTGRVERHAVAHYLASLGGPVKTEGKQPSSKEMQNSVARGQRLFHSVGCLACHRLDKPQGMQAVVLRGLGNKTTPERLAAFLQDPLAINPSGRMPHMLLQTDEARDLARFLCQTGEVTIARALPPAPDPAAILDIFRRVETRREEQAVFERLSAGGRLLNLGKRLVIDKGCNNCHTLAPGGKAFATMAASTTFDDLKNPNKQEAGCLAATPTRKAPHFPFTEADRQALRVFLRDGVSGAGSSSPVHEAQAALQRFNCLACHNRNGEGGLTPEIVEELRRHEKAENAEAVSPPPLTGAGHKLRTSWLRQVLTQAGRARPWMGLRMPQFGEANVGKLPEALTALDGALPEDTVHRVALTPAKVDAGRHLVGKNAMGCIGCHDIAGIPNTGTRGPDLSLMNQRVRYDWYRRWLEQAQRMQPGTRMPTVFPDGKSLLPAVLNGDADAQAEAMWAYLSLGMNLPLPEGLEPPKGLILAVRDRPVLLRTFLPEAGSRAIAVGYPRGVAVAFDATACRLAYAWSGNFLDASPVWNNRGGAPAKVLGPRFWTAPLGHPWSLTDGLEPPDFTARTKDPAFGGPLPDGKLLDVPSQLTFAGYTTDAVGLPTFRYRVHAASAQPLAVSERPEPLHSAAGLGVARHFTLEAPAGKTAWLLAGEAGQEPRALDAAAGSVALNFKAGPVSMPAEKWRLLLPQGGDRVVVLSLAAAPPDTRWHVRKPGGTWQVLLQVPARKETAPVTVRLEVWAPYRDDPALLKELFGRK